MEHERWQCVEDSESQSRGTVRATAEAQAMQLTSVTTSFTHNAIEAKLSPECDSTETVTPS